jgi:hypothetical protein
MSEPDERLKIYELLTQEIQSAEAQTYQIVSIGGGAIAAILAAAFNQRDPYLRLFMSLTAYLVILPMLYLLAGNRSRIWRIASYMRTFLEPELSAIKWQTHLSHPAAEGKSSFIRESQMLVILIATSVVGLVSFVNFCLVIGWTPASFEPGSPFSWRAIAVAVIALILNIAFLWSEILLKRNLRRGGDNENDWLKSWKALQDKLEQVPKISE